MRSLSGPNWDTTATFEAIEGGTRVDWTWSFELGGLLGLFGPVFQAMFQRTFTKDLQRLKGLMESGAL